jgi:molybdenum cofactor biosynthesis protein B
MSHASDTFVSLGGAVLTVSDTRTEANDTSGNYLKQSLEDAGHRVLDSTIIADEPAQIRERIVGWINDENIKIVLITGGTGFYPRDVTPQAVAGLFEYDIPGFGELFRQISFQEIGASTIQSRAMAGMANRTLVFCLPGSTGACRTAWEQIICSQVDARHHPCNFVKAITGDE